MKSALAGVKVLDFGWVIAVPMATKMLAEYGATVVRVESKRRPDILRSYGIYAGSPGINRGVWFGVANNDKYGITLDLNHPSAGSVVERLVKWADIAVENFTPGALEGWNLGYDDLSRMNPGLILIRAGLFGQTGPYARQPGVGTMMQALAGFTGLLGWPNRPPTGTPTPCTDYAASWYIVTLAMSALDRRRRTGQGGCFDLSQLETGLHYQLPALLDAAVNSRATRPNGNRHPAAAPHGVFACQGDDRWCSIAVHDDAQWLGLCRAMGCPAWSNESRFATLLSRKQHEDELEQRISEWTRKLSPEAVMELLQQHGVPAGRVDNGKDNLENPQLRHRGHFIALPHPEMGEFMVEAPASRLSETPSEHRRSAPCFGEHTELVCREFLEMPDHEFVALLNDGVFE